MLRRMLPEWSAQSSVRRVRKNQIPLFLKISIGLWSLV